MKVFRSIITYGLIIMILTLLGSCSGNLEDNPVATVGDKALYQSNIKEILPKNCSPEDSILLVNEYINKWVKEELMVQKADENLTAEQKDVNKELQAYRNSLLIYKYKNELIKQHMDTLVTSSEIEEYYNQHPDNFNLNRSIVKAVFVAIPSDIANPEIIKELLKDTSEEGIAELREYCGQYAKKVEIALDHWIDFQVLKRNFPVEIEDTQKFLREKTVHELNDSNYYYIVSIHDYKLTNDLAPIEFVENNIKNLILNQRKIEFLKEIEKNIYNEGVRKNKFKIYNRKTNED